MTPMTPMQHTVTAYAIGLLLILGYAAVTLIRLVAASRRMKDF